MAVAIGTTLTALAVFLARKTRRDLPSLAYPGHWRLVMEGAAIFIKGAWVWSQVAYNPGNRPSYWSIFNNAFAPALDVLHQEATTWGLVSIAGGLSLYFGWTVFSVIWRLAFAAMATGGALVPMTAFQALLQGNPGIIVWSRWLPHFYAIGLIGWACLLSIAAVSTARRRPFDSLHWLGVALALVVIIMQLVVYLAFFWV